MNYKTALFCAISGVLLPFEHAFSALITGENDDIAWVIEYDDYSLQNITKYTWEKINNRTTLVERTSNRSSLDISHNIDLSLGTIRSVSIYYEIFGIDYINTLWTDAYDTYSYAQARATMPAYYRDVTFSLPDFGVERIKDTNYFTDNNLDYVISRGARESTTLGSGSLSGWRTSGIFNLTNNQIDLINNGSIPDLLINIDFINNVIYSRSCSLSYYILPRGTKGDQCGLIFDHTVNGRYRFSVTYDKPAVSGVSAVSGVPEPSVLALISLGLLGLSGLKRQRLGAH